MLSTVTIEAFGYTGEEVMVVTAGETELLREVVPSSQEGSFTFDVDDSLSFDDLRINFVNDLYEPGVKDRNLSIRRYVFDGINHILKAPNVFSTGTYVPGRGVEPGYDLGSILHQNGYIQVQDFGSGEIDFNGNTWQVSRPFSPDQISVDPEYNELVVNGSGGEISLSRQIKFEPGALVKLTVDAWRNQIYGSIDNAGVGAGVDFCDAEGNELPSFFNFDLNDNAMDPSNRVQSNQFTAPANATSAFLWIWVGETSDDTLVPLRLTDLRLETVDLSQDVEPPVVTISGSPELNVFSVGNGESAAVFNLRITDNFQVPPTPDAILSSIQVELIDPEGRVYLPRISSYSDFGGRGDIFFVYYRLDNFPSDGSPLVEGDYSVRLIGGTLADARGNFAPDQIVATIPVVDNRV